MTEHPADERSHDDVIREARTRIRAIQTLTEHYCNTSPPDFGPNSVAAGLRRRWTDEIVPAAQKLHECSRELLQQLPYTAFQDLPAGPSGVLSESEDLARDMGDNAQTLAQTPFAGTGNQELNARIADFLAYAGGIMQDTGHGMRAKNDDLAQQERAAQQGGDQW